MANYRISIKSQEEFIQDCIKERSQVAVIMINGYQMRGTIIGFDQDVLFISADGKTQMVYKHAVSTIVPNNR